MRRSAQRSKEAGTMVKKILSFTVLVVLALSLASCQMIQKLQARDQLNKGVQSFKATKFDAAIDHFKKAIELDPELKDAELYLATGYAQQFLPHSPTEENQKIADLAVQTFQKVLDKDPTNKTALAGIASIYQNNDQYDKAREAYMKNAQVDPQNHIPFYAVGSVDWIIVHNTESKLSPEQKGTLIEEGMQYLDKAMTLNPNYEDTLWYQNLLLREKAIMIDDKIKATKDKNAQKQMMSESEALKAKADEWSNRALEVRKKNAEKKTGPGGIELEN
jgi:tetratricopeptide (TPR) repeat protein